MQVSVRYERKTERNRMGRKREKENGEKERERGQGVQRNIERRREK
jgi:hypothetical protein